MALKFFPTVAKGLKLKFMFRELIPTFVEVTGEKLIRGTGGGAFFPFRIHDGGRYHIETSPLICPANQSTGFYMITASVMKELKMIVYTRELLNLSVETMNSVVDDIIYLSPCRSVLKILSRKWIVASISRL